MLIDREPSSQIPVKYLVRAENRFYQNENQYGRKIQTFVARAALKTPLSFLHRFHLFFSKSLTIDAIKLKCCQFSGIKI